MIVAGGAGPTLEPDAGFAHLCQGAFEGRPQGNDFAGEGFLGRSGNFWFHMVCIYYYIHTMQNLKKRLCLQNKRSALNPSTRGPVCFLFPATAGLLPGPAAPPRTLEAAWPQK